MKPLSIEDFLDLYVTPPSDHGPDNPLRPRTDRGWGYAWHDDTQRSEELLKGDIAALSNEAFLEGWDASDPQRLLLEIRRAWTGGFVSGQLFGHIQGEKLLEETLYYEGPERLRQMSQLDLDLYPRDREGLFWLKFQAGRILDGDLPTADAPAP